MLIRPNKNIDVFRVTGLKILGRVAHIFKKKIWKKVLGFTSFVCFVCFIALRPKSTAMVIAGRSVHLSTLFPGQA